MPLESTSLSYPGNVLRAPGFNSASAGPSPPPAGAAQGNARLSVGCEIKQKSRRDAARTISIPGAGGKRRELHLHRAGNSREDREDLHEE